MVTDYLKKADLMLPGTGWDFIWWAMAAPPASVIPGRYRKLSPEAISENDLLVAAVFRVIAILKVGFIHE